MQRMVAGLGTLTGTSKVGVEIYRGVPYAQPPAGPLRFAPPQPISPWQGALDATRNRSVPPQTVSRVVAAFNPKEDVGQPGEDCLNLSIWVPKDANSAPVLFWIHGGGFMAGSGSQPWYDGERFAAEHGIIVVSCNYRLGALGYTSLPELFPDNRGLLDQIAALRWVQEHIASFGGDPANVTAAGQSAGAHAIVSMLGIEEADGLFKRAILHSTPGGMPPMPLDQAASRADRFLAELGLERSQPDVAERLATVPLAALLEAQTKSAVPPAPGDITPPYVPVDGSPYALGGEDFMTVAARRAAKLGVEVLIGWTRDESALFLNLMPRAEPITMEQVSAVAANLFGNQGQVKIAEAKARRGYSQPGDLLEELITDRFFREPSLAFAHEMEQAGGHVSVFRFDWPSPDPKLRAAHCAELPFTFGNVVAFEDTNLLRGAEPSELKGLVTDMMTRWASFIAQGNAKLACWSGPHRPVLFLDAVSKIEDAGDLAKV